MGGWVGGWVDALGDTQPKVPPAHLTTHPPTLIQEEEEEEKEEEGKVLMAPRAPFQGSLWPARRVIDAACAALLTLEEAEESLRNPYLNPHKRGELEEQGKHAQTQLASKSHPPTHLPTHPPTHTRGVSWRNRGSTYRPN